MAVYAPTFVAPTFAAPAPYPVTFPPAPAPYPVTYPQAPATAPSFPKNNSQSTQSFIANLKEARRIAKRYWNPAQNTGVWMIDNHHQILFAIIQKLNLIDPEDDNAETINNVLGDLAAYARYHFRLEERLFISLGLHDPNVANHHGHENFINTVQDFRRKLQSVPYTPAIRFELLGILNSWWGKHILGIDVEISKRALQIQPTLANPPLNRQDEDVRVAFDVYDENGDGHLQRDELENVLSLLGEKLSQHELNNLIQQLDSNRDGVIQFEEFKAAFGKLNKTHHQFPQQPTYATATAPTFTAPTFTAPTFTAPNPYPVHPLQAAVYPHPPTVAGPFFPQTVIGY